jgi:hypothetical protein
MDENLYSEIDDDNAAAAAFHLKNVFILDNELGMNLPYQQAC